MVDHSRQVREESLERSRIVGVECGSAERGEFACGALQSLGVSRGEDNAGSLRARPSRRFEPDAGAPADHDDGLPEQFRFAQHGRGGWGAHDSSDQRSKIAFAIRRDVRYFFRREASPALCMVTFTVTRLSCAPE